MKTPEPWTILNNRWGHSVHDPSRADFERVACELFDENNPHLAEGDYAEHPDAWLRYGFDDGPMSVIRIGRGRTAHFEQWADPDYRRTQAGSGFDLEGAHRDGGRPPLEFARGGRPGRHPEAGLESRRRSPARG